MMKIHFLDTTVFCNILNVYMMADEREIAMEELKEINYNSDKEKIILPFATIIETGNHISHISDGNLRYQTANRFCETIIKTVEGYAPWTYYGSQLTEEDLKSICEKFPESVKNCVGVGDLSIIRAYEKYKDETPGIEEIRIWSYDQHLKQYHDIIRMPDRRRH